jgi:four helix bundle protein
VEKPHKKLNVWKSSLELVTEIYGLTKSFPEEERYGLTSQMRRATVSIPSNIAEGAARKTKKEFTQFLHVAQGSLSELDTHLEIARRLTYVSEEKASQVGLQMEKIDKMLTGLIKQQQSPYS